MNWFMHMFRHFWVYSRGEYFDYRVCSLCHKRQSKHRELGDFWE